MRFDPRLEAWRVQQGTWRSPTGVTFGSFFVPFKSYRLYVMACDGTETGWDHVSVTHESARRCPNWEEMCFVKSLFWGEDETVLQFHPAQSDYVNLHPHCLHLWKPIGREVELPPRALV